MSGEISHSELLHTLSAREQPLVAINTPLPSGFTKPSGMDGFLILEHYNKYKAFLIGQS